MQTFQVEGIDIQVPVGRPIRVDFPVDPAGERCPAVFFNVTGGRLDCYKSDVSTAGDIHLHMFGEANAGAPQVVFGSEEEMHMGLARITKMINNVFSIHPIDMVAVTVGIGYPLVFTGSFTWTRPKPSMPVDPTMVDVLKELS